MSKSSPGCEEGGEARARRDREALDLRHQGLVHVRAGARDHGDLRPGGGLPGRLPLPEEPPPDHGAVQAEEPGLLLRIDPGQQDRELGVGGGPDASAEGLEVEAPEPGGPRGEALEVGVRGVRSPVRRALGARSALEEAAGADGDGLLPTGDHLGEDAERAERGRDGDEPVAPRVVHVEVAAWVPRGPVRDPRGPDPVELDGVLVQVAVDLDGDPVDRDHVAQVRDRRGHLDPGDAEHATPLVDGDPPERAAQEVGLHELAFPLELGADPGWPNQDVVGGAEVLPHGADHPQLAGAHGRGEQDEARRRREGPESEGRGTAGTASHLAPHEPPHGPGACPRFSSSSRPGSSRPPCGSRCRSSTRLGRSGTSPSRSRIRCSCRPGNPHSRYRRHPGRARRARRWARAPRVPRRPRA